MHVAGKSPMVACELCPTRCIASAARRPSAGFAEDETPVVSRTARGGVLEKDLHQVADREDADGIIAVNHG